MSCCPTCHYFDSTVNMTRKLNNGWIKRWRRCDQLECGTRWHTYEMPVSQVQPDENADLREIKREVLK